MTDLTAKIGPADAVSAPKPDTPVSAPANAQVKPPASRTRVHKRHYMLLISFCIMVLAPATVAGWYLWGRAADQYASTVGFSVRQEESGSALDFLGGSIASLSGSSSTDTDILYEFIQSQKLVADMDAQLDLKALWSAPENDPFFAFNSNGSIEDLIAYWNKMVQIYYDRGAGLIEVRVLAFRPEDATLIAEALFEKSSEMINDLSAIAREDAIRYSREELVVAEKRLTTARQAVLEFRNQHQIVDPAAEVLSQSKLIGSLQEQMAEALIEIDLLRDTVRPGDPRIADAERRARVIEERIAAERHKLGERGADETTGAFASLISNYERLIVEREFAEKTYISALATYDASLAESRRKSRYLAAYMQPTKAETARFPERGMLQGLLTLFLFLAWAITALVAYSLKDRR